MMSEERSLREKKLRGSGGYVFAKVTDERFSKYFCNKCEKEYKGSPSIKFENPNEDLGEGVTLAEKGEYKCSTCNTTIAQYRKFDSSSESSHEAGQQAAISKSDTADSRSGGGENQRQRVEKVQSQHPLAQELSSQEPSKNNAGSTDSSEKALSPKSQEDITFQSIQSLIGMPA